MYGLSSYPLPWFRWQRKLPSHLSWQGFDDVRADEYMAKVEEKKLLARFLTDEYVPSSLRLQTR